MTILPQISTEKVDKNKQDYSAKKCQDNPYIYNISPIKRVKK